MPHTAWKELTNIYGSTRSWVVFRRHKTYLLFLSFLVVNKSFILSSQYRDCCWPGDARSQVSNSHSIVINFQEYSGTAWKGLTNIYRQSSCRTVFGKHKKVFTFLIISGHWDRAGIWNPSPWKSMAYLYYVVNTMTAVDLTTQGARSSAVKVLSEICTNILAAMLERLIRTQLSSMQCNYEYDYVEWHSRILWKFPL